MHMWWEKGLNVLVFFSSLFFVALFIGITLTDTDAYQNDIDLYPRDASTLTSPVE
jgi:cytochrome c oxidase subunit 4